MSQHRGMRRDRPYRSGGYGGGGDRSGGMGRVNPWEGGMVPGLGLGGSGGGPRGGGGLLPTPSSQSSNILSQLTSPDAQLILASNLLSSLLRPQQSQQQAPPLLSLNTMPGGPRQLGSGMNLGPGGPRGFQDRRRRTDNRRNEPYSRPGARSRDSQNKRSQSGGPDRNRSSTKTSTLKSPRGDKKSDENKDRQTGDAGEDVKVKREHDDDKKDERKEEGSDKKKEQSGEFAGIPEIFLYCQICRKHMWDEHSFQNHVRGRAHQLMVEKMEENYRIKVELMRHEMKVAEQRREVEMERLKRQGRKINLTSQEYCTMCDLSFFGYLIVHRKTARHQKLKAFLHPSCEVCNKEFPTRIEWDKHCVTAVHMKNAAEVHKGRTFELESDDLDLEQFGCLDTEIYDDDPTERNIMYRSRESQEEDDIGEAEKIEKDKEREEKMEEDIKAGAGFRLPKYNPDTPVGLSLLKKVEGQYCRVCRRFFLNDDAALKTHCRTLTHYNNYISLMKLKARLQAIRDRRENADVHEESGDETKQEVDDNEDDSGNWKRRRTAKDEDDGNEKETKEEGGELYDPMNPSEDASDPSPEANGDSRDWSTIDKMATETVKDKNLLGDDPLWEEVDRDIGTLLDTVDQKETDSAGEDAGGTEEKMDEDEDVQEAEQEKQTRGRPKPAAVKTPPTRGNSATRGARRRK